MISNFSNFLVGGIDDEVEDSLDLAEGLPLTTLEVFSSNRLSMLLPVDVVEVVVLGSGVHSTPLPVLTLSCEVSTTSLGVSPVGRGKLS